MKETCVQSLVGKHPLEKEMATTPVFLSGKFHGQRSLEGCSPWGRKESNMIEQLMLVLTVCYMIKDPNKIRALQLVNIFVVPFHQ